MWKTRFIILSTGIAEEHEDSEFDEENVAKAAATAAVAAVSLLAAGVAAPIAALLVSGVWKWMTR